MTDELPGEQPPLKDVPTLRQELTLACREVARQLKNGSRATRRDCLVEAWEIMRGGVPRYDAFQVRCAEIILRALTEAGGDLRHFDDGLTTALGFLKTRDDKPGGKILVES